MLLDGEQHLFIQQPASVASSATLTWWLVKSPRALPHFCWWHMSKCGRCRQVSVIPIDPPHKSYNAIYPTMHHFVTEMCTRVQISVAKWCIVGCGNGVSWDFCDKSINRYRTGELSDMALISLFNLFLVPNFKRYVNKIGFSVITQYSCKAGAWNPVPWKTRASSSYIVNIMVVDGLVTQGARASAAIILNTVML